MEKSASWEPASRSATEEGPKVLWNPKFHYSVHESPQLIPILSHISPVHNTPSYFSKINFNIIFLPRSRSF
jgi:hypothetical protein